jgi:hypothetical protein
MSEPRDPRAGDAVTTYAGITRAETAEHETVARSSEVGAPTSLPTLSRQSGR